MLIEKLETPIKFFAMSFLDVDTVLSEEERIPCIFEYEAVSLGFLDPTAESPHLPENSKVEIPLWMCTSLASQNMVRVELPKHFERKMRDEILAGASNINFNEYSYYFFEVGMKLAKEGNERDEDLEAILRKAFSGDRYRDLMNHCLSSWNEDLSQFSQNLTCAEHKIFLDGIATMRDLHNWRMSLSFKLQPSKILGIRKYEIDNTSKNETTKQMKF